MPTNPNMACRVCGKPFYCTPYRARHGGAYCTRSCYYAGIGALTPFERRLLDHRAIDAETGCWLWLGARSPGGYGILWANRARWQVSRIAMHVFRGFDLNSPLYVLHHCDNPPCFNPDHLFIGTQTENVHDMIRKGRARYWPRRGRSHPRAKLTEDDVRAARQRHADGQGCSALAREYGVSHSTMSRILSRHKWKHVA